jgi:hypothetical protein
VVCCMLASVFGRMVFGVRFERIAGTPAGVANIFTLGRSRRAKNIPLILAQ